MEFQYSDLAKMIDHSLLNPTMTVDQLEQGIELALDYDVASVCIMPYYLRRCSDLLAGSTVMSSTTIGFPHGGHTTESKKFEAERAIDDGCQELDMVVNISKVLSGDWGYVQDDVGAVIDNYGFCCLTHFVFVLHLNLIVTKRGGFQLPRNTKRPHFSDLV